MTQRIRWKIEKNKNEMETKCTRKHDMTRHTFGKKKKQKDNNIEMAPSEWSRDVNGEIE